MKAAGSAMTQIHGSMTIDKVDETMYVSFWRECEMVRGLTRSGTNSENNTNSARKLPRLSPASPSANNQTRTNWTPNSKDWSRRLWTSVCSRQGRCLWLTRSTGYLLPQMESVSLHPLPFYVRQFLITTSQGQNEASRGRRRGSRAREAPCRNGHVMMHVPRLLISF